MTNPRSQIFVCFAVCSSVFATLSAFGQPVIHEELKIVPEDPELWDAFGSYTAINGNIAVIGVPSDDDNGNISGSAYLFDTKDGQQLRKLTPDDAASGDIFGEAIAINGDMLVIGAPGNDDDGFNSGCVYIFDLITGQQLHKLVADDASSDDYFGRSIAIDGDLIVIGSAGDSDNGTNSGSAYIFDANTGEQIHKLLPDDGSTQDNFGLAVSISENTIVIGAPNDNARGAGSGSAYIFDATSGLQLQKITASDGVSGDSFGRSIAIEGTTAVIGAHNDDNAGSAYLFNTSTALQLAKLIPIDRRSNQDFGFSVAFSGSTIVIGAMGDNTNGHSAGSAYLFDVTTGQQTYKLLPSDGENGEDFGTSVAISDQTIIVGAPDDEDNGPRTGSVFVFSSELPCPPDLTGEGDLNLLDISAFLDAFSNQDPIADFVVDDDFNFFDVSEFLRLFAMGCP